MENFPKNFSENLSQNSPQKLNLRVAIPGPFLYGLNYSLELANLENLENKNLQNLIGLRVLVPLRHREVIGIILEVVKLEDLNKDLKNLKPIIKLLDQTPIFPAPMQELLNWAARYYHYPIGEVYFTALPKFLCQGKEFKFKKSKKISAEKPLDLSLISPLPPRERSRTLSEGEGVFTLTPAQDAAISNISKDLNHFSVSLLEGVTGSGKTEVYLQIIEKILSNQDLSQAQKQILMLVPEIGLTPQTLERFRARFKTRFKNIPILAYHSELSDSEKLNIWVQAAQPESFILIGTRSALFAPFNHLALVIIDEEHDLSFKQQSQFKYHARDLAIKRCQLENIPCLLGSATPSLESQYQAQQKKYSHYFLPTRPGEIQMPTYFLIDMRAQNKKVLSDQLIQEIKKHLDKHQQVLIFINRRGYAPVLTCFECGHIEQCTRCDAAMTLHTQPLRLSCHHCGRSTKIPKICPQCEQLESLCDVGIGTEKIEQALIQIFPDKNIIRIDRSNTQKKGELEQKLLSIHDQSADILIGTQMIAKGHHFENVSLVGIINLDDSLASADFRAVERAGQLLTQVAGRAGRAKLPGSVLIQTYHPDNPLLKILLTQGYQDFSQQLFKERQEAGWPPFSYLALFQAEAKQASLCLEFLEQIVLYLSQTPLILLGPAPALLQKKAGFYRYQLLIQSQSRAELHELLNQLMPKLYGLKQSKVKFYLDIDPLELG